MSETKRENIKLANAICLFNSVACYFRISFFLTVIEETFNIFCFPLPSAGRHWKLHQKLHSCLSCEVSLRAGFQMSRLKLFW